VKVEIKISDVKRNGKKISIKETFDSLENARAWIDRCLFIQTKQILQNWINEGMPRCR
jgi:hypothetical protein